MFSRTGLDESFVLTSPDAILAFDPQAPRPSAFLPGPDVNVITPWWISPAHLSDPSLTLSYPPPPVIQNPLLWVEPDPQPLTKCPDPNEPYRPPMQHKVPPQKGRTLWPCTHRDCRAIFNKRIALEQVSTLHESRRDKAHLHLPPQHFLSHTGEQRE